MGWGGGSGRGGSLNGELAAAVASGEWRAAFCMSLRGGSGGGGGDPVREGTDGSGGGSGGMSWCCCSLLGLGGSGGGRLCCAVAMAAGEGRAAAGDASGWCGPAAAGSMTRNLMESESGGEAADELRVTGVEGPDRGECLTMGDVSGESETWPVFSWSEELELWWPPPPEVLPMMLWLLLL